MAASALSWPQRVRAWDAALAAVRATLRARGLREVSTPTRVEAVALEPWIEPIPSADRWLATSPELEMKRLLAQGSGCIFQIAHVFRRAERGARHSEEFHLIEWYRDDPDIGAVMLDVEAVVAEVFSAVERELGDDCQRASAPAPRRWQQVEMLPLMSQTLGVTLAGDEDASELESILVHVRESSGLGLSASEALPADDRALAQLLAWTELFSLWSDLHLDPWLAALDPQLGTHVCGFPRSLAALSELEADARLAARFESHVHGVELANGYRELRDPVEQRRRFERVAAMRQHHGLPILPMPEHFLEQLEGLPACAGVALGLDRLVALACRRARLDAVTLADR